MEYELKREIRSILRERRMLKSSIHRLSSQVDSDGATTLLSNRTTNDMQRGAKRRNRDSLQEELPEEKEKRPKREVAPEHIDGQKRILRAGLLGHLQRARDSLAKEREKESVQKQHEKDRVIETKLEQQQQATIKALDEELKEKLASQKERMQTLNTKLTEKNNEYVKLQLTRHYENMGNFIATKTQPTIFWVPRNFNPELEALRDITKQFITQKVAAITATDYFEKNLQIN